ncbi:MAG: 50S ribosomal protein L4 [Planctomycetaceae bacterium]|jgi:large subunit ribosomal protein L4|nr:50S ribosomal protein L4 [Planctomycetaceae bacterium]
MANVELPIFDKSGKEIDKLIIDPNTIASRISSQLLHDAVVMYQSNLRQGSAKSKTRAEVAGHKKKMYRQKGTGNARAGHRRSGVRKGGGHIFAKQPRDWSYRLPRKALQVATRMAVASKINDSQITLIDALSIDMPKTKEMASVLNGLKIKETVLVAIESYNVNLYKSFRNIDGVRILPVSELNAYEILRPKRVLFTKAAFEAFVAKIPAQSPNN